MGGGPDDLVPGPSAALSVVIPAFDEAESIAWTLRAMGEGLDAVLASGSVGRCEIVVVDDHSTDGTWDVLQAAAEAPGSVVRPVRNRGPQGLGSAIRHGLGEATGDLVLYTDADLPFDPVEIPRLIGAMRRYEADIVCGYRLHRTAEGTRRAVQSHAYNLLARAVLPIRVRDVNFACKLLRRRALDAVLPELRSVGPFIDAELVARFAHHDLRIVQVGVDYFPRFDTASTLGGASATLDIVREASTMVDELRRRR